MNLKNLLVFVGIFLWALPSLAQNITIKGSVKDTKGEPMMGAFILIKGTQRGTSTDFDGNYTLNAQVGDVLRYSFLGMKTVEKKVTAGVTQMDIVLQDDVQQLEGTVVTGYGSRKVASRTVASVSQVQGKDIMKITAANAMEGLQGKVAGLVVTNESGRPGASSEVLIHGLGTFTAAFDKSEMRSTNPLYLLDGVQVSSDIMTMINPNDIESITVLKDAASISIYGARAANGVILITTKRGKRNERTNITVNHQLGVTTLTNVTNKFFDDLVTPREYMDFWLLKSPNEIVSAGRTLGYTETDPNAIANRILAENPYNTRWDKVYFRNFVPVSRTDVSVSGGNNTTSYYLSGGYLKQEGMQPKSDFNRYNLNLSVDTKITDWLRAALSVSLAHSESELGNDTDPSTKVLRLPFYSPVDKNGKRKDFINSILGAHNGFYHPNYIAEKYFTNIYTDDILPVGSLTFEPIKGLTFKTQAGIQYNISETEIKGPMPSFKDYKTGGKTNPSVRRDIFKSIQKTYTNLLEYHFNIATKNDFNFLLGQESIENRYKGFNAISKGQPADALSMLSHGTNEIGVNDSDVASTFNSYFTRLEYSYAGRYFLDLSARRDGSSAFIPSKRYQNFWAVGLMWKAKQEKFLENVKWLTDLSLRFSTGVSGNSRIGDYRNMLLAQAYADRAYKGQTSFTLDQVLGNPELSWEEQGKTTFGLNMVIARNTSLNIEYYDRRTSKILSTRAINSMSGYTQIPDNIGDMQNQGIDITLSLLMYRSKNRDFSIRGNFNLNYNKQKVTNISYGDPYVLGIENFRGYKVGSPIEWVMPVYKGINNNGESEWYLPGEDRLELHKDDSQITNVFDKSKLAQTTGKPLFALFNGGFGFEFGYKNFTFDMNFSYAIGNYKLNEDRAVLENPSYFGTNTFSKKVFNYWKQPGDDTDIPKIDSPYLMLRDTRLLEDASYVRLRSIGLSYSLPEDLITQMHFFSGVRIYTSAQNIFTITKYTGADPETGGDIALGAYPPTRQYSLGVELKF
ncbi:SusC/RagA family TonB-linked outer membrane protein [Capnocytophaga sp. HP1101]